MNIIDLGTVWILALCWLGIFASLVRLAWVISDTTLYLTEWAGNLLALLWYSESGILSDSARIDQPEAEIRPYLRPDFWESFGTE